MSGNGWLAIAGLGPGDAALITPEVTDALTRATDVIGYIPYVARVAPRPASDATFLQGLLEGLAEIERQGYARLQALGAPPLRSVRTVGGGAANAAWTRLRERRLGVPMLTAAHTEAAVGAARLAALVWRRP